MALCQTEQCKWCAKKNTKNWCKRLTRRSRSIILCNCFSRLLNTCITLFTYGSGKNSYVLSSEHIDSTLISQFFRQNKIHFCSHSVPLLVSSCIHLLIWLPSQIHVLEVFSTPCLILAQSYLFLPYKPLQTLFRSARNEEESYHNKILHLIFLSL